MTKDKGLETKYSFVLGLEVETNDTRVFNLRHTEGIRTFFFITTSKRWFFCPNRPIPGMTLDDTRIGIVYTKNLIRDGQMCACVCVGGGVCIHINSSKNDLCKITLVENKD